MTSACERTDKRGPSAQIAGKKGESAVERMGVVTGAATWDINTTYPISTI